MNDQPVKIGCDDRTRIVVQQAEDGTLVASIQRRWEGQWAEFAQCSGANGEFLIFPKDGA